MYDANTNQKRVGLISHKVDFRTGSVLKPG